MNSFSKAISSATIYTIIIQTIIILSIAGYPIVSFIPAIIKANDSTSYSFIYRTIILGLSGIMILYSLIKTQFKPKLDQISWAILLFWAIYLVRMIYDLYILGVPTYNQLSPHFFLMMSIGGCLIPTTAILLNKTYVKLSYIIDSFFYIQFVLAILITLFFYFDTCISYQDHHNRLNANDNLNSIGTGYIGAFLVVLSLYNLFYSQYKHKIILSIIGIPVGLFVTTYAASRAPFLVGGIAICILLLYDIIYNLKFNKRLWISTAMIGILCYISYHTHIKAMIERGEIVIINRIESTNDKIAMMNRGGIYRIQDGKYIFYDENGNTIDSDKLLKELEKTRETRSFQWETATNQFFEHPLIGDQIFEKYLGMYPHNIYIEVLMAVGILGGIPFYFMFISLAFICIKNLSIKNNLLAFGLIAIMSLLSVFLSSSIYSATQTWLVLATLIASQVPNKKYK